ncbi:MAG: MarR family winged helix-turn-helix transcriptional regulator [Burkholderiaceae bacterium]|nr:MarR family winged helix-turn-helix transcriptional regulator [Burkholderiaceae bacterium]
MTKRATAGVALPDKPAVPALEELIPYLVFRISRRLNARLRERMRQEGVTIHRWRVLAVLSAKGRCSASELAAMTVMEQSVISRVADKMVRDGLVRREVRAADRRVSELRLSARGKALVERLWPVYEQHGRHAIETLTEAEWRTLVRLLQKVSTAMDSQEKAES